MARAGFIEKVKFEKILGKGRQVSHVNIWGQSFPGTESSHCKGPGMTACAWHIWEITRRPVPGAVNKEVVVNWLSSW